MRHVVTDAVQTVVTVGNMVYPGCPARQVAVRREGGTNVASIDGPYTIKWRWINTTTHEVLLLNGDEEPLAVFFDEADAEYVRGLLDGIWMLRTGQLHHAKINVEALENALRITQRNNERQGN